MNGKLDKILKGFYKTIDRLNGLISKAHEKTIRNMDVIDALSTENAELNELAYKADKIKGKLEELVS